MKVMHLLQSDKFSGAENVVCQIISMFKSDENIEFVYCSQDGPIKEALTERNIKFNLMNNFSISEIKRVIKEEKPDIIHAHDMRAGFYAAICCGNIPLVSHIHNNNFNSRGLSLKAFLYMYAAKKAKHIFWVSNSSFEGYKFHNFFKKKSSILYNVINIELLKEKMNKDENTYKYDIVYIGRLTYQKNPQRLLKVLEKVLEIRPQTKIAIIGTGDLEEEIKNEISSNNKLENVDFLGFKNNPYKILSDSKLMLMTSRWEGTPMCALEAMSLGVPIVSTPVDGMRDLVENGETGYLSDSDDELIKDICEILDNKRLHDNLSDNSIFKITKIMNSNLYKNEILKYYLSE